MSDLCYRRELETTQIPFQTADKVLCVCVDGLFVHVLVSLCHW